MQESHTIVPVMTADDTRHAPLHNDIVQCAHDLWIECGRPADRDLEIWLKAEKRLFSNATPATREKSPGAATSTKRLSAKPARY